MWSLIPIEIDAKGPIRPIQSRRGRAKARWHWSYPTSVPSTTENALVEYDQWHTDVSTSTPNPWTRRRVTVN